jgi:hypothetical protein
MSLTVIVKIDYKNSWNLHICTGLKIKYHEKINNFVKSSEFSALVKVLLLDSKSASEIVCILTFQL